jgi:putative heme-binding domain-containing protein
MRYVFLPCLFFFIQTVSAESVPLFRTVVLDEQFFSEGADFGDFDGDGNLDVVSGPFWYAGPDFSSRHAYASGGAFSIKVYSDHFFSWAHDIDTDGDLDILAVPIPGRPAHWFENPGHEKARATGEWKKHLALSYVGGESPGFADLTGDGKPELIGIFDGAFGYASPGEDPTKPWPFTPVTPKLGYGQFTHGMGIGDANGDGRLDLLEKNGWWEQTAKPGEPFQPHAFPFAQSGGSQMFAYDFDGDGDNDVVSVQNAHGWGLKWFERRGKDNDVSFIPHEILPGGFDAKSEKLNISQMHALALADIDGDGVKDLVTGKRYYAHGGNDPGAHQLPVLVWFRTVRTSEGVRFEPRIIAERIGVGTQLSVRDVTGNGRPDILVGNKLGTFLLLNEDGTRERDLTAASALSATDRQIGTDAFKKVNRETEPLSPEDELKTFSLPPGFKVELFAAEPQIDKPMNMAFDTKGRLWVSSSQEYPIPAPDDRTAKDTIRILEDTNGDGRADKVTTFADGLNIPMGLYPYRDGVVCFSIPNIWFLRDTDGDGKADKREKLYGPFDFSKDTHGMCNAFRRGYDGWLYACHGFNNTSAVTGGDGTSIVMHSGNTFRFRLDGERIEHYSRGMVNPFGSVIDPYGDFFVADCHTKPISLILKDGYYDSFGKPHDGLGYVPNVMDHTHGSTAIGGLAQYNAEQFPPEYRGSLFSGNVMTSRINRNSLQRNGGSIRAREEPDFLISGDPWFRPVDFQLGPDGALYVADFYNRIIGHYEVDLDHPDRDRRRGRIWKITYTGKRTGKAKLPLSNEPETQGRTSQTARREPRPPGGNIEQKLFESANQTERRLVANRLVDEVGPPGVELARTLLKEGKTPPSRAEALWVLFRTSTLTDADLSVAMSDEHELVRTHAFRVMAQFPVPRARARFYFELAIQDKSPTALRAAVTAAGVHGDPRNIATLLSLLHRHANDPHLRHVIRMSLRDHLAVPDWFQIATRDPAPRDVPILAGMCLALKTPFAGEFLAKSIGSLGDLTPETMSDYMRFAVRYVSPESVAELATMARKRFENDVEFQLELLAAARDGIEQRGGTPPEAVRTWALEMATKLLAEDKQDQPLTWTYLPHPDANDDGNSFVLSTTRKSQDGMSNTPLISSFPLGEKRTGIYRSATFEVGREFSFWMAGHDGLPDKPYGNRNFVRMVDAISRIELAKWKPPRNDTAQRFEWKSGSDPESKRRVFVEIVDGDSAGAYAWLAVGRFSEPGLNPNGLAQDRRKAAKLVGDFQLTDLRDPIVAVLNRNQSDREITSLLAEALVRMEPDGRLSALAIVPGIAGAEEKLRAKSLEAVIGGHPDWAFELLPQIMLAATAAEQARLAERLVSDAEGAYALLNVVAAGRASARLLTRPEIADRIAALGRNDSNLSELAKRLTAELPDENQELVQRVVERRKSYLQSGGSREAGFATFEKRCAACHQIGGKGKKVGPNLDGIGNRGLDRLAEDILIPNRNVDVAFRATTIITKAGKVFTGLEKRAEGARVILVDGTGKEISIPTADIDERVKSARSPMPENLGEMISDEEFRNLLAWLLTVERSN